MDIGKTLKTEMARIGQKEAKKAVAAPNKRAAELRRLVADLRRRVDHLEKTLKLALTAKAPARKAQEEAGVKAERVWFTGAGVRALRKRMKLSQKELAALCGVTQKAVSNWETAQGKLTLRAATKNALVGARTMSAKQAKAALGGKKK